MYIAKAPSTKLFRKGKLRDFTLDERANQEFINKQMANRGDFSYTKTPGKGLVGQTNELLPFENIGQAINAGKEAQKNATIPTDVTLKGFATPATNFGVPTTEEEQQQLDKNLQTLQNNKIKSGMFYSGVEAESKPFITMNKYGGGGGMSGWKTNPVPPAPPINPPTPLEKKTSPAILGGAGMINPAWNNGDNGQQMSFNGQPKSYASAPSQFTYTLPNGQVVTSTGGGSVSHKMNTQPTQPIAPTLSNTPLETTPSGKPMPPDVSAMIQKGRNMGGIPTSPAPKPPAAEAMPIKPTPKETPEPQQYKNAGMYELKDFLSKGGRKDIEQYRNYFREYGVTDDEINQLLKEYDQYYVPNFGRKQNKTGKWEQQQPVIPFTPEEQKYGTENRLRRRQKTESEAQTKQGLPSLKNEEAQKAQQQREVEFVTKNYDVNDASEILLRLRRGQSLAESVSGMKTLEQKNADTKAELQRQALEAKTDEDKAKAEESMKRFEETQGNIQGRFEERQQTTKEMFEERQQTTKEMFDERQARIDEYKQSKEIEKIDNETKKAEEQKRKDEIKSFDNEISYNRDQRESVRKLMNAKRGEIRNAMLNELPVDQLQNELKDLQNEYNDYNKAYKDAYQKKHEFMGTQATPQTAPMKQSREIEYSPLELKSKIYKQLVEEGADPKDAMKAVEDAYNDGEFG